MIDTMLLPGAGISGASNHAINAQMIAPIRQAAQRGMPTTYSFKYRGLAIHIRELQPESLPSVFAMPADPQVGLINRAHTGLTRRQATEAHDFEQTGRPIDGDSGARGEPDEVMHRLGQPTYQAASLSSSARDPCQAEKCAAAFA
jgi:hypothetical protein